MFILNKKKNHQVNGTSFFFIINWISNWSIYECIIHWLTQYYYFNWFIPLFLYRPVRMDSMFHSNKKDAPEVTGHGEPFDLIPSKMTVNVLRDDVIKYTNFHFSITICSEISSFQNHYPPVFCVWKMELSRQWFSSHDVLWLKWWADIKEEPWEFEQHFGYVKGNICRKFAHCFVLSKLKKTVNVLTSCMFWYLTIIYFVRSQEAGVLC